MKSVRIAMLGAGRMGSVFARHLCRGVDGACLVAVADVHADRAAALAHACGNVPHFNDAERLLKTIACDAVVIATPTHTHCDLIERAAERQRHIFCEKPLALRVQECDRALAAVQKAGVILQVGFMRRFDTAYARARQAIDQGELGTPVLYRGTSRDPEAPPLDYARPEHSGGLLLDMGVHEYDLAVWLLGDDVVDVHAVGTCMAYPQLEQVGDIDNAVVSLRFAGGGIAAIDLSRNAVYGYDIRAEVLGTGGAIAIGGLQQTPVWHWKRNGVWHDTWPFFMERFAQAYRAELEHFVHCISTGTSPLVDGAAARRATLIGVAANRSLREHRPVSLQEIDPLEE